MKEWRIPVVWQEYGFVNIEADTLAEAMKIARDDDGEIPLPEGNYVDDSWQLDTDDADYVRSCYNDGQKDEEE